MKTKSQQWIALKQSVNEILHARISIIHFLVVLFRALILCGFLFYAVIPIIYWLSLGDSASNDWITDLPINRFIGNWGAYVLVLLILIGRILINRKRQNLSRAKSHLLTTIILTILYFFRVPIMNFIFFYVQ